MKDEAEANLEKAVGGREGGGGTMEKGVEEAVGRFRVGRNGAFFGEFIAEAEGENKETGEGGKQWWKEVRDNRIVVLVVQA